MFKKRLTLKIILFLLLTDILETSVQFCFKKSALTQSGFDVKALSDVFSFLGGVLSSWFLWAAFLLVLMEFIIWATILSKIDLSVAVPVASLSYLFVPAVSIIFLHEKVTTLRWIGIAFILMGVIFVSMSSKERRERLE